MERKIVTDQFILSKKSVEASQEDISIGKDLLDTIKVHKNHCVGMAANMIGENKRIIVVLDENRYLLMYNPMIIKAFGKVYETEEGCLSLSGMRKTKRYEKIKVKYYDEQFKIKIKTYSGYVAQIIQHEIDHCEGILI